MARKDETPPSGGGDNGEFIIKWKLDAFSKEYFVSLMRSSKSIFFLRGGEIAKDSEFRLTRSGEILEIVSENGLPEIIACYGRNSKNNLPKEELPGLEGLYDIIKELFK